MGVSRHGHDGAGSRGDRRVDALVATLEEGEELEEWVELGSTGDERGGPAVDSVEPRWHTRPNE